MSKPEFARYKRLHRTLSKFLPANRLFDDDLRTLAYGTDASFYRLIPKLVVKTESEAEVVRILETCRSHQVSVTFRAAGTSLSGQAVTESVLVVLGRSWRKIQPSPDGLTVTLQPGVIGSHANLALRPYSRKIGPDPASLDSCMVGGIAANNASGMCCGTAENSYNTLSGMRIIFADGSTLDTNEPASCEIFRRSHNELISKLDSLARKTKADPALSSLIQNKFKMKNTTGYSLNALIDFDDPIDIIQHLMIGSEGTLGFIAEITYETVEDHPFKATSLMLFPDIASACQAVILLKNLYVSAVELMDRASLHSVQDKRGMPDYLGPLGDSAAALLVEVRTSDFLELQERIDRIEKLLKHLPTVRPISFTTDKSEYTRLWNIRKGLFPSVGAVRETGTAVIIEDVVFPIDRLADAVLDLERLFKKHGYEDAILFGHALEGNLHFVFKQDFSTSGEVHRYESLMNDVVRTVTQSYKGSLKAEHGTGRNMAPFVEVEWGSAAYQLMKEIKTIFDPDNILNPGVILNSDPKVHLKNLKPMPPAHPIIDKCIECGYCESYCPSKDLTLTPRQRIVIFREISRLERSGEDRTRLRGLREGFRYQGDETCAADGLCATSCPVDIDTGNLVKELRRINKSWFSDRCADWAANHFDSVTAMTGNALNVLDVIHSTLGTPVMEKLTAFLRQLSWDRIPAWNRYFPRGNKYKQSSEALSSSPLKVVYVPSCLSRTSGLSRFSRETKSLPDVAESLLQKAGYEVLYPNGLSASCCGLAFSSRGFFLQGEQKRKELERELRKVSRNGEYPILIDTSPCHYHLKQTVSDLNIHEPAEFIQKFLKGKLTFKKSQEKVAIHPTCSAQKMGLQTTYREVAELCSETVIMQETGCCGFAGDKGMRCPELTASALGDLKDQVGQCAFGFSSSKTCEMGLSLASGIPYESLIYLADRASEPVLVPAGPRPISEKR